SRVQLAGDVEELLATHHRLVGARSHLDGLPEGVQVIEASYTDRQSTLIVRSAVPVDDPSWSVESIGLADLVLAYMTQAVTARPGPGERYLSTGVEPEHHPYPLVAGQAARRGTGQHGHGRAVQPLGELVGQPHRHRFEQPPAPPGVRRAWGRPDRVRRLRLRP